MVCTLPTVQIKFWVEVYATESTINVRPAGLVLTVTGTVVGVPVAVGVGDPHGMPVVPISWNIWSGALPPTHAVFSTQSVLEHIKAPPGLRNAAPLFDCTARSAQPHCPFGVKFMFAWNDNQKIPELSEQKPGRSMLNWPVSAPAAIGTLLNVQTALPGRVPML